MVIKLDIVINKGMPEFNFKSPVVTLDIYKEVGIMLDADGRVILDKSINYGK